MNTQDFENRFMQLISGQMPLPQSIFRQFLGWLGDKVPDASSKQDATDSSLETDDKTIVGAINEVRGIANNALDYGQRSVKSSDITYEDGSLYIRVGGKVYTLTATEEDDTTEPVE